MDVENAPVFDRGPAEIGTQAADATSQAVGEPGPTRSGGGGMLAPMRRRNFALLFSGQLISTLGDQVYGLALPWTVLIVTHDPRQVAIVLAAGAVARVLLLLIGGALADRLNPRVVMLGADVGRVVVVGALGVILFFGLPPLWIVASLAALEGAGSGLFGPGIPSLLPRILPDEELPAGNGLVMVLQYSTLALGPLLGGVATAAEATLAFLADAGSFVVSAVALFAMRLGPTPSAQASAMLADGTTREADAHAPSAAGGGAEARGKGLLGEIGTGLAYTFRHPLIRSTMMVTVLGNLGFAGTLSVALIVLSHNLSPSAVTLGLLLAAAGVGGVVGGLSAGLLGRLRRRGVAGLLLFGLSGPLMAFVPVAAGAAGRLPIALTLAPNAHIGLVAGLLGVVGLILALGDTMFITVMQQRIQPEYMARVFSAQFVAGGIAQPLSLVGAGFLTAVYGPGVAFLAGAGVVLLGIGLGLASRELREI